MVEGLLTFETGPLGKDHFVLKRQREYIGKELPLLICDFWGDSANEEECECESICFEEWAGDVVEDDFIEREFSLGQFLLAVSCVDVEFAFFVGSVFETGEEESAEVGEGESIHVVDFAELIDFQEEQGAFFGEGTIDVSREV